MTYHVTLVSCFAFLRPLTRGVWADGATRSCCALPDSHRRLAGLTSRQCYRRVRAACAHQLPRQAVLCGERVLGRAQRVLEQSLKLHGGVCGADARVLEHQQGAFPGGLPLQARLRRLAGAAPALQTCVLG